MITIASTQTDVSTGKMVANMVIALITILVLVYVISRAWKLGQA